MSGKAPNLDKVITPLETALRENDSFLEGVPDSDITVRFLVEECVSIKKAKELLAVSQTMYIRQRLWNGRLEGVKVDMGPYEKWFITKESINYYRENSLRANKPKKYILYVYPDSQDKLLDALRQAGIYFDLRPNYTPTNGGERWTSEGGDD